MWAQDVAVHILCAHRVAQDMTATSCKFGPFILCGAQDVAGCAQDMVCRILCAAQDLGSGSHRIAPPQILCAKQDVGTGCGGIPCVVCPDPVPA